MGKGFGGMPGNMKDLMKQAQNMQKEIERAQEESKNIVVESSAGGGMVQVVVNGNREIQMLTINKEVVNPEDVEMLQDLITAAINDAMSKIGDKVQESLAQVTGGFSIPGLF